MGPADAPAPGAPSTNWVGGEPTIHLHTIVEAIGLLDGRPTAEELACVERAKPDALYRFRWRPEEACNEGEFNAPVLWNSNFFMSPEATRILRTLMDVWLPDFKFGSDRCSIRLARTPWYWETVTRNHQLVHDWGEDMVIRLLIMPNHIECCTKPVLRWIAEHTPRALVNVMDRFHPDYACDPCAPRYDPKYRELARTPTEEEILEAYRYARALGLRFEELSFLDKNVTGLRVQVRGGGHRERAAPNRPPGRPGAQVARMGAPPRPTWDSRP